MSFIKMSALLLFLIIPLISGCAAPSAEDPDSEGITIREMYPGSLSDVDTIRVIDGSSGERRLFRNKRQVQAWIQQVKDVTFTPDPNQGERDGFLFNVDFLEHNKVKLSFTPNSLEDRYYIHNEVLLIEIQKLLMHLHDEGMVMVQ
ncbi:hypothetical protein MO973_13400 [Paenibacillus sp. TRM 82003]|nr:hypothetical protein [Paenibacillus sp. TRM 82003]